MGDLILFKKQLILNSYEMMELKEGDRNEKCGKHGWRTICLKKDGRLPT